MTQKEFTKWIANKNWSKEKIARNAKIFLRNNRP